MNSEHGSGDMTLAPDQKYLVIYTRRPGGVGRRDLYVSLRRGDGRWGELVHLGNTMNTEHHEWCPMVTPDGKYLFFSRWFGDTWERASDGEVYWVDVRILDRFRPPEGRGRGQPWRWRLTDAHLVLGLPQAKAGLLDGTFGSVST